MNHINKTNQINPPRGWLTDPGASGKEKRERYRRDFKKMRARVVVTGMGIVSPIGIGVSEFWKSALAGQSGISTITSFDPFPMDGYRSKVAGQVRDFAIERFLDSAHGERVDRYAQFGLVSTKEALADSGLQMAKGKPSPHRSIRRSRHGRDGHGRA